MPHGIPVYPDVVISEIKPIALNYREAAKASGLCPRTLRRAIQSGRLASVREGRAVRILLADLEAYLEAQRQPTRDEAGQ